MARLSAGLLHLATTQATIRVRLQDVVMPKPVPAGMNPFVLMSLAYRYRSSSEDAEPIVVRHVGQQDDGMPTVRIVDGRHRYVASLIAGRQDVLAIEVGA